jgi:putative ABC transport system permease protein
MHALIEDVRFGLRRLLHRPFLTLTIIVTLGLGIGATTAVFTVLDALLLRPLPFHEPDRLVQVWKTLPSGSRIPYTTPPEISAWQEARDLFPQLEVTARQSLLLEGGDEPRYLDTAGVTEGMLPMLGVPAALGRTIGPGDRDARLVVIGDALWRSAFGADPSAVGRSIRLDTDTYEIVGVMPAWFKFPDPSVQAWTPLTVPAVPQGPRLPFQAIGRLAPGVTLEQADARAAVIHESLIADGHAPAGSTAQIRPFREHRLNPAPRQAIWMLFGACGLVLLIACANVAHLLLAQGVAREREVAIRAALGASRGRVAREYAVESLMLALAGGAAGVLLASWGVHGFVALAPADLTAFNLNAIAIDRRVLAFALAATLGSSLLVGLAPAWRATRPDIHEPLKAAARATTAAPPRRRIGRSLIVAEVALALVLLTGAGLLMRTFLHVTRQDVGVDTARLVSLMLEPPQWRYATPDAAARFFDEVAGQVRGVPGVAAVGVALGAPPRGGGFHFSLRVEAEGGVAWTDDSGAVVPFNTVSPGYFAATGTPLFAGRDFTADDRAGAPPALIVSEAFARRVWPSGNALGSRVRLSDRPDAEWHTVVGIAGNVYQFDAERGAHGMAVYYPAAQARQSGQRTLIVRATGNPAALIPSLKAAVWSVDPSQPISRLETGELAYAQFFAPQRFYTTLLGIFAGIGALLAGLGIYGLMAYTVAQRTQEFGVRLAMGALPRDLARLVLGQAARLATAGIVLGLGIALLATRAIEALLIGVSRTDAPTYAAVAAGLCTVMLVACWLPLRRAAGVDPVVALRHE